MTNFFSREMTKIINIGCIKIGGKNKIAIQSMTNAKNIDEIIDQIYLLKESGCDIVRCAIPDFESAENIKKIKSNKKISEVPIVADIHFDYRLALESIKNGADKIRINPGNINNIENLKKIISSAKNRKIPIRIGINSGSLEKNILKKYDNKSIPDALVESAIYNINFFNSCDFDDLVLSVKSSNIYDSVNSYEKLSYKTNYPLHVGITEAGINSTKSCVGIGIILYKKIGNTIRVSLTGDPLKEIKVAKEILSALELRKFGVEIISCPTCARTNKNFFRIVKDVEEACKNINKNIKVAIMGCEVNGPGEASNADIGVACFKNSALIFKNKKIIKKINLSQAVDCLIKEIKKYP